MSYGLMVYSVDLEKVKALSHSGDDQTRRAISGRFRERIAAMNDDLGWSNERGEPSIFEALRHLIMGGEMNLDGAMYAYAYEFIVAFYGRALNNAPFMPCDDDYFNGELTDDLKATGVDLDLGMLTIGFAAMQFPSPDDFPGYGYWSAEKVQKNLPILQAAENKTEENETVLQWLEYAAPRGESIVGFWY